MEDGKLNNKIIGMRIREVMTLRGVSVEQIAESCSKEINTVHGWLSGKNGIQDASLQIIIRLLDINPVILHRSILELDSNPEIQPVAGYVHIYHSDGFSTYIKMGLSDAIQLASKGLEIIAKALQDEDKG